MSVMAKSPAADASGLPVTEGSCLLASPTFITPPPQKLPCSPRPWPQPLGVLSKGMVPRWCPGSLWPLSGGGGRAPAVEGCDVPTIGWPLAPQPHHRLRLILTG